MLNGEATKLGAAETVAGAVQQLGLPEGGRGIAVAVGGEVVPRSEWSTFRLRDGDRVELVQAVQGG
jgi:sulfur carrier protein